MKKSRGRFQKDTVSFPSRWSCPTICLLVLLCSLLSSEGWQQHRILSGQSRTKNVFAKSARIRSVSTEEKRPLTMQLAGNWRRFHSRNVNHLIQQESRNENNNEDCNTLSPRRRLWLWPGRRKQVFRKILSVITLAIVVNATAIVSPALAEASIPSVATVVPPPAIVSCPISSDTEMRLVFRIVYGALMGAALGKERAQSKHSAGVRTMSLVSMGAAVFTLCSCYGFTNFSKVDASRMAANVPSGVGFVGAGVITTSVHNRDQLNPNNPKNNVVHGLTTAATIWLSAAVGVSCGVGLLRVATVATFATIGILRMGRAGKDRERKEAKERAKESQRFTRDIIDSGSNYKAFDNTSADSDTTESHRTSDRDETNYFEYNQLDRNEVNDSSSNPDHTESKAHSSSISNPEKRRKGEISPTGDPQDHDDTISKSVADESGNNYIDPLKDPSHIIEEIVQNTWKKSNDTVAALVDLVIDRVELRERASNTETRSFRGDDPSSSSKSGYRP